MSPEKPPRVGLKMLLRAALATFLIVSVCATAVAVAVIREVEDITAQKHVGIFNLKA